MPGKIHSHWISYFWYWVWVVETNIFSGKNNLSYQKFSLENSWNALKKIGLLLGVILYWNFNYYITYMIRPNIVQGIQHYPKRELNMFLIVSFLLVCYKKEYGSLFSIVQGYTNFFNLKKYFCFLKSPLLSFFQKCQII